MMYAGFANRPDGFVPMNAIFMNFVILIPIWQGIDWLRQRRIARGLAAVLIPLIGWPALFIGAVLCGGQNAAGLAAGLDFSGHRLHRAAQLDLYHGRRHHLYFGGHRTVPAAAAPRLAGRRPLFALGLLFYLALPMRYLMASGSFAPGLLFGHRLRVDGRVCRGAHAVV